MQQEKWKNGKELTFYIYHTFVTELRQATHMTPIVKHRYITTLGTAMPAPADMGSKIDFRG
jgi:hypothetical protein